MFNPVAAALTYRSWPVSAFHDRLKPARICHSVVTTKVEMIES